MSTHLRLLALTLVVATLTLVALSCSSKSEGGLGVNVMTLTELNPKVLPLEIEDDADPKDTLYLPRAAYKPATAVLFPEKKDFRLLLRGKKDGAAIRTVLLRDFLARAHEIHVRVGFDPDKTTGLMEGQSLAFFELVLDTAAAGSPPLRRLEAVYSTTFGGSLTVRATDGTSPLGVPLVFAAHSEVVLQFRLAAGTLFLEAGAPTGEFVSQFTPSLVYSEVLPTEADARQGLAWGATGLGKKGSVYFNQLTLDMLPDIGVMETPLAVAIRMAYADLESASFGYDLPFTAAAIKAVVPQLEDIEGLLDSAVTQQTLQPITQGALALKNVQKALTLATKGMTVADKLLAKGSDKFKPVKKKARQSISRLELAFAQVAGFRSNKTKKLFRSGFLPFGS